MFKLFRSSYNPEHVGKIRNIPSHEGDAFTISKESVKLPDVPETVSVESALNMITRDLASLDRDIEELEEAILVTMQLTKERLQELQEKLTSAKHIREAVAKAKEHLQPQKVNYEPLESLEPHELIHMDVGGHDGNSSSKVSSEESVDRASRSEQANASKEPIHPKARRRNPNPSVVVSSSGAASIVHD
jgi:hypothetical protein